MISATRGARQCLAITAGSWWVLLESGGGFCRAWAFWEWMLVVNSQFVGRYLMDRFMPVIMFCNVYCVPTCVVGSPTEVSLRGGQYFEWRWWETQWGTEGTVWEARLPGFLFPRCHACRLGLLPSPNATFYFPGSAEGLSATQLLHQGKVLTKNMFCTSRQMLNG